MSEFAASEAWPIVDNDLNWFYNNGQKKKLYLSQVSLVYFRTVGLSQTGVERLAFGDLSWSGTQQPFCGIRCSERKGPSYLSIPEEPNGTNNPRHILIFSTPNVHISRMRQMAGWAGLRISILIIRNPAMGYMASMGI